ncbi:MAG: response regulator [Desulfobulbaceae bacterium]|nr:response regulator [Desulfobulbaceae bacterium]
MSTDSKSNEITQDFVEEVRELSESVEGCILDLEKNQDSDIINKIYRNFHTIKGTARMLGFNALGTFAHQAEDLFSLIRDGKLIVDKNITDLLLRIMDMLETILDDIEAVGTDDRDTSEISALMESIFAADGDFQRNEKKGKAAESPKPRGENIDQQKVKTDRVADGKIKILVVDDEIASRVKAETILSEFGECDAVAGGRDAIDAFLDAHENGDPYDLITMDIDMPDMNGIEALKRIRDWEASRDPFPKEVKVIMMTADDQPNTIFTSFRELCGSYIVKPFNREQIRQGLKKAGVRVPDETASISDKTSPEPGRQELKVTTDQIGECIILALGSTPQACAGTSVKTIRREDGGAVRLTLENGREFKITITET